MKRFGARGALSDPPQLGESVVVLAWEAEAAIAKVAEAAVVQILGSDQDTRDALTEAFRQGQADMLAKCIAAVEAFDHDPLCMGEDIYCCSRNVTLNVLRALGGSDESASAADSQIMGSRPGWWR